MTSSNVKDMENTPPKKLNVGDTVPRRPSFKCTTVSRSQPPRSTKRLTLPASTVQALTNKFNSLSNTQNTGHTKRILAAHARQNIRVVVCRPVNKKNSRHGKTTDQAKVTKNLPKLEGKENEKINSEPIYDKHCLPVKAAIGLFERGDMKPTPKPIAAIKPILKVKEEKPKPKLSPKDSLCRVRYNVMRRSKEVIDEAESEDEKPTKKVVDEGNAKEVDKPDGENISVTLRQIPSIKTLENLKRKLAECDVNVELKESGKKLEKVNNNKQLDTVHFRNLDVIKQSLTRIDLNNLNSSVSESKANLNVKKNTSSLFNQISQSKINSSKTVGNERRFATLLKNEVRESEIITKVKTQQKDVISDLANIMNDSIIEKKVLQDDGNGNAETTTLPKQGNIGYRDVGENHDVTMEKPIEKEYSLLKPNASFLWSKPLSPEQTSNRTEKALPKPPDSFIPDLDTVYDTIDDRTSLKSDETDYDDISSPFDEETYDDIGVSKLNEKNKNESLYCISEQLDTFNIYEDIQSLRAALDDYDSINKDTYETVNETYEDVGNCKKNDDAFYDNACYESIYGTGYRSSSNGSVKSSFEKNNSLYGVLPEGTEPPNNSDSLSETDAHSAEFPAGSDSSNSDDWVEISDSEPEQTVYLIHERHKKSRGTGANKTRANWSELQKRTNHKTIVEDINLGGSEEHLYESITQNESISTNNTTTSTEDVTDDWSGIDDFESSDEECPDAQLPAEPSPQYNITRSLRDAGKRLRQNLTLRKSDFSRSLKKLRPRLRKESLRETQETNGTNGSSKFYCEVAGKGRGQRPSGPPPPPPLSPPNSRPASGVQYADLRISGPELYAECGLFKQKARARSDSRSSWYTEIGLYGTNGEPQLEKKSKQIFTDEPLYQFYTECVNQQAREDILQHYDSDGYEAINNYYTLVNEKRRTLDVKVGIPNLEDFASEPERKVQSFQTQNRTLWCQVPEVINSCILATLTEQQQKLQEAKFEILTSEGSYMHSLTVLENHFMPRLAELISNREYRLVFSNIIAIKDVAERLLNDLEACWQDNILLIGICDVVYRHALEDFKVYVKFCKHHTAIYRTLRELIDNNQAFAAALRQLESSQVCQNLSLHSFLLLPMQRITRLPLLLGAMLARLDKTDDEFEPCKTAFELLNKIVRECDDEASKMEKCEEMLLLSQQLEFPKDVKRLPIISGSRALVKRGVANLLSGREDSKLTFGRRANKLSITLLLFTDLIVLARQKGSRSLVVLDYCPRNLVELEAADGVGILNSSPQKHLMLLTLLENHENKTAEMMLAFNLESDRQRWIDAVCPKLSDNPEETVYEEWDCPQVIAIYEFTATQPDELSLCIGDIVNVLKKIGDGWFQGERLRDASRGCFPANHTQEISSAHVRAKNKKQRYKLLALSGNFLMQQQGKI